MREIKRKLAVVLALCLVITNVSPAFATEALSPDMGGSEVVNEVAPEEVTSEDIEPASPAEAGYSDLDEEETTSSDAEYSDGSFIHEATVDGITITLTADSGVFPEEAELSVETVEDEKTEKAIEEAVEKERDEAASVASSYKFDIKMLVNGEEVQPDTSKGTVKVAFKLAEKVNDCLEVNAYHLKEDAKGKLTAETLDTEVKTVEESETENAVETADEDGVLPDGVIENDIKKKVTAIEAETDGFSYYVVEFTYDKLQYVLPGDSSIKLSVILEALAIKGTVSEANVSNETLFTVEKDEDGDDWTVTAIQAFSSKEWMKVTIDGTVYEIVVIDAADNPAWDLLIKAAKGEALTGTAYISYFTVGNNEVEATDTRTITLKQNITCATPTEEKYTIDIPNEKTITIDLNGYTIDRGLAENTNEINGRVINVNSNATLTLMDNSDNKRGRITGGYCYSSAGGGVLVEVNGTFNMYGGTITGNKADKGGGVSNSGGTVIMNGGTITDNNASNGGGIYTSPINDSELVILVGGEITQNKATQGGGVYVKEEECFAAGTLITMKDGSRKPIETLEIGDVVRTFDHDNGEVSSAKLFDLWKYPEKHSNAVTLHFSHNIDLTVVYGHSFFDREANKYVSITRDNVDFYVGHEFYNVDDECWETLIGYDLLDGEFDTYVITSEKHLNCIANGMLSNEDGIYTTLTNVFEYGDGLRIDVEKKEKALERYGLFAYEELQYVSRETYDILNLQYLNVALGKGMITKDTILSLEAYWAEVDPELLCSTTPQQYIDEADETCFKANTSFVQNDAPKMFFAMATSLQSNAAPGVYLGGTIKIIDNLKDDNDANNLYLSDSKTVTLGTGGNAPTDGMSIGVTTQTSPTKEKSVNITSNGSAEDVQYFSADKPLHEEVIFNTDHLELAKKTPTIKVSSDKDKYEPGEKIVITVTTTGVQDGIKVPVSDGTENWTVQIENNQATLIDTSKTEAGTYTYTANISSLDISDSVTIKVEKPVSKKIVTFIYRNGKENTTTEVLYNEKVSKPSDPKMEGYTFDVWCSDAECKIEYDFSTPVIDNLPLYARWRKDAGTEGNVRTENKVVEIIVQTEKPEEKELLKDLEKNKSGSVESANSLADAVKNKVKEEATKNGKDVILFIDTQLTGIKVEKEQTGETEKATTTLTYDATPWMSTVGTDGKVEKTEKISNSDLNGNIKLRLPVPVSITEKYVNIVHSSNGYPTKTYKNLEIVNKGTNDAYVEIQISHFSTFELTFSNEKNVDPVPYKGNSGSGSTSELFTGRPGNPVTNGTWNYYPSIDKWTYTTTRKFTSTWAFIANPYADNEAAWFYFDEYGYMLTGWHWLYWNGSKKCYYFNPKKDTKRGKCQLGGVTPDGHTVDETGAWTVNGVVQTR